MHAISQQLIARLATTFTREDGQTMAEYGIILAVVVVIVAGTLAALATGIGGTISDVVAQL